MIKDGLFVGDVAHEFYGEREGLCAWCNKQSTKWYIGELNTNEFALYNVCQLCYDERMGDEPRLEL